MNFHKFPISLQRKIEDAIASGDLSEQKIVTVGDLSRKYKASIGDVQLVLPGLERKGLVKKKGVEAIQILGLYKAEIESVFQYAEKSKLKPETIVRSITVENASESMAEILSISEGDPLFVQVRTRKIGGQVLANQYNFIPYEICPGLEEVDLSRTSFQVTLEKRFRTIIARIEETYSLKHPERDDMEILSVSQNQPVLVVQRTSFSRNGYPLVFADIHVNPTQFHYVKDLWPEAVALIKTLDQGGK